VLCPRTRLRDESESADEWSRELGLPFHEAVIEVSAHRIELVFRT
jgi:hypothetical protein